MSEMTKPTITPDEFRLRMKEIAGNGNAEEAHLEADQLMCYLLEMLGYDQGVELFRSMPRWYA